MSYILEALRRAEREREHQRSDTPAPGVAPMPPPRRLPWYWIAGGALLAFGAGALLIFLLRPAPPPSAAPAQPAYGVPAPAAIPPAVPAGAMTESGAQGLKSLDDLVDPNPQESVVTENAPVQEAPAAAEAAPESVQSEPEAEPQPLQVERIKLQPAPTPAVQELQDMPASFRADFPRLTLDAHVYDDDPQKRFVMINTHRYREGDALREGPQLVEITSGGVILNHRGQQVLLPLGR